MKPVQGRLDPGENKQEQNKAHQVAGCVTLMTIQLTVSATFLFMSILKIPLPSKRST